VLCCASHCLGWGQTGMLCSGRGHSRGVGRKRGEGRSSVCRGASFCALVRCAVLWYRVLCSGMVCCALVCVLCCAMVCCALQCFGWGQTGIRGSERISCLVDWPCPEVAVRRLLQHPPSTGLEYSLAEPEPRGAGACPSGLCLPSLPREERGKKRPGSVPLFPERCSPAGPGKGGREEGREGRDG